MLRSTQRVTSPSTHLSILYATATKKSVVDELIAHYPDLLMFDSYHYYLLVILVKLSKLGKI